jgi:hypothetical protein
MSTHASSSSLPAAASASNNTTTRKKRPGNPNNGVLISIVLSISLFLSLLQLFDPTTHQRPPSAMEMVLKDFYYHKTMSNQTIQQTTARRENNDPLIELLQDAGVYDTLHPQERATLPTWQHVVHLYGDQVRIVGKERCEMYRSKVKLQDRKIGVAGLFNTGTNLLDLHLQRNVHGVENLWQVPWGKHRMASVKLNHTAKDMAKYHKENVLPVIIVRDPLAWLQSMCKSPYAAHWRHGAHHCPNLVPSDQDLAHFKNVNNVFSVKVNFDAASHYAFDSLAHLWSEWHQQYMDADYPLLFSMSSSAADALVVSKNMYLRVLTFCIVLFFLLAAVILSVRFEE